MIELRSSPFLPGRWAQLASAVGLAPRAPAIVALSGGADSVFLLHVMARAAERPPVVAVHVDHGLRGAESNGDADFCRDLCARLGVPILCRSITLDVHAAGLEARARVARYRALSQAAEITGVETIVTGHHADDELETLILRWLRGSELAGLAGLRARTELSASTAAAGTTSERAALNATSRPLTVVRPLVSMRREEVRELLRQHGLAWREDGSNASPVFARNRVRNVLLPKLAELGGDGAVENLHAFVRAVEELEDRLAHQTGPLAWSAPRFVHACHGPDAGRRSGTLARERLTELATPLRRRALWRLVCEGTGRPPSKSLVERVLADLSRGALRRHALPGGYSLTLRRRKIDLEPPRRPAPAEPARTHAARALESELFPHVARDVQRSTAFELSLPGCVALGDGRYIRADIVDVPPGAEPPRSPLSVELDADDIAGEIRPGRMPMLAVRFPRPGDRFRPLGGPGEKRLCRFLADAGVPRDARAHVPLVFWNRELVWVAGIRPCEPRRVRRETRRRLVLGLEVD